MFKTKIVLFITRLINLNYIKFSIHITIRFKVYYSIYVFLINIKIAKIIEV